jgi:putative oxidoreductase
MEGKHSERARSIGLLILRLGVGGLMLTHGWGKLKMLLAGDFAKFGDPIGLGPHASLILVVGAEFLGAVMVVLGLATRFAALSVVVAMAVAAFVAHADDPWSMEQGAMRFMSGASKSWASKEPALLYLIPFLALVFTGAGRLSIDAAIVARRRSAPDEGQAAPPT